MRIPLDPSERRILSVLQGNARLTNQDLADQIGLSPSPCWRRVRSLEERGVIRGYVTLLDPGKVGIGESVFCNVTLERHSEGAVDRFEQEVMRHPEILECYAMTGDADYLLRVVVDEVRSYDRFLHDFIFRLPGVAHVRSHFALRAVKYDTALPLEQFDQP
ncbi:MAG: Lrp/AsnC family transcriptional regulator [Rhodospirillaceae bacterium]